MEPERWDEVVRLFHAARETTGEDRSLLLKSLCHSNRSLRIVVEQMLREDANATFLDRPILHRREPDAMPHAAPVPAARFGRYQILAPIGRGGMGEVWSARDCELERLVALKFLPADPVLFSGEDLTREARMASALNHPNIVTVYEVIHHEEAPIIAMEFVEGDDLRTICGKPLPADGIVEIALQIARALAAAHGAGLIHGDIKPENILLRRDGYLKIVDFGLARPVVELTEWQPTGGTPRYMPPEQARGEPASQAGDIFSFGLVLYEIATGRHAFAAETVQGSIEKLLAGEPIAPIAFECGLHPGLATLIMKMLASNPAERPSAAEIASALAAFAKAPINVKRGATRSRLRWMAPLGAVLIIAGAIAWWLNRNRESTPAFTQVTSLIEQNRATAAAISPNGESTVYANTDGIFLRNMRDGTTSPLASPGDVVIDALSWFPDSTKLLASGFSTINGARQVWRIYPRANAPELIRKTARNAVVSPDGARIAFIVPDRSSIWVMNTQDNEAHKIVEAAGDEVFPFVLWSPDGRRLSFVREKSHGNRLNSMGWALVYPEDYESIDIATGHITARVNDIWIESASALADNSLLFLRWMPKGDPSMWRWLWEVRTNPNTGAFIGSPRPLTKNPEMMASYFQGLSATADGKKMVVLRFQEQNAVSVADYSSSPPRIGAARRLTLDARTSYPHGWTADSRAVIFESNRGGHFGLYRQNLDQRTAQTLIENPNDNVLPQLSPDGRWILYAEVSGTRRRLMRVPVTGGAPSIVPIDGDLDEFRCALRPGARCVLRTTTADRYFTYFDLDPIRGQGVELARTEWMPALTGDWDLSADGGVVALPNHDFRNAVIRLVPLNNRRGDAPKSREVVVQNLSGLRSLVAAVDGKGWFASVTTSIGNRLYYIYPDGRPVSLGNIQGWAVPSPDGRHVAFLDMIGTVNAWLIERR
jgi:serine/threonine protein kinase